MYDKYRKNVKRFYSVRTKIFTNIFTPELDNPRQLVWWIESEINNYHKNNKESLKNIHIFFSYEKDKITGEIDEKFFANLYLALVRLSILEKEQSNIGRKIVIYIPKPYNQYLQNHRDKMFNQPNSGISYIRELRLYIVQYLPKRYKNIDITNRDTFDFITDTYRDGFNNPCKRCIRVENGIGKYSSKVILSKPFKEE